MVVGLVVVAILVMVAGAVHTDPRQFVLDPSLHPLSSLPAYNGYPSDHTAVAAVTAVGGPAHRRTTGLVLLVLTVLIGAARVLAHVHHVQDIVAGGAIGLVAAVLGVAAWHAVRRTRPVQRAAGAS